MIGGIFSGVPEGTREKLDPEIQRFLDSNSGRIADYDPTKPQSGAGYAERFGLNSRKDVLGEYS